MTSQNLKLRAPMKDQFERACLSVVLNLAEGSGKPSRAERRRFYGIAMGSLRETQAILELAQAEPALHQAADKVGASLFRLMQNPGGSV
jgi:four helix bundle protein